MRFTMFLAILILLSAASVDALDKDGLVLYLPFDEGSGEEARDISGQGNHGTLEGNVEWVDGQFGKAVHVKDDSAANLVSVADDATLDVTDQMTVAAWVLIETVPDGSCSWITKADTYMVHTSNWSGNGIEQELLLWPFDQWQTAASTPIQLNEWRHVVGTFDGADVKMYIDGELMGERAYGNTIAVTNAPVIIGRDSRACCNGRSSSQILDEVMLWDRALDAGEVQEVMDGAGLQAVQPEDRLITTWSKLRMTD